MPSSVPSSVPSSQPSSNPASAPTPMATEVVVDSRDEDSLMTLADKTTTVEKGNDADTIQEGDDGDGLKTSARVLIGSMAGLAALVGAGLAYNWHRNKADEADANSYGENGSEGSSNV